MPTVASLRSNLIPLICAFVWVPGIVGAQQGVVPLQRDMLIELERDASLMESRTHTGLKPVIESRADLTNVLGYRRDTTKHYYWVTEKVLRDHLLEIKGDGFRLCLDPLFEFQYGTELVDRTEYAEGRDFYANTRGVRVKGDLGKVSFHTMFHETQTVVPGYLYRIASLEGVLPGHGRVKFEPKNVLDVGWSQSVVAYEPVPWLNVQLGQSRHFVGHGYRSMLLSDHAPDAPHLKFSALMLKGRLQYTTWHSKLTHRLRPEDRLPTGDASESLFYWSRARFNHLSADLGRVQLGLFEATMFRNLDPQGMRPFDALELNPLIGLNTAVNGFDGTYKTLVGADLRVKLVDKAYVYGQWASDKPGERMAWQAGLRIFDLLWPDLHVQLEYNAADPFMYQHVPVRQAYVHAGLPLAHPMGAYFTEAVAIVEQGYRRFRLQGKVNLAHYNRDRTTEENHGSDPLKPDILVTGELGPVAQRLTFLDINGSYLVNPVSNLRLMAGYLHRDLVGAADSQQSGYLYIALRTGLFNRYYDL